MSGDPLICMTETEYYWSAGKFVLLVTILTELVFAPLIMGTLRYFFQREKQ